MRLLQDGCMLSYVAIVATGAVAGTALALMMPAVLAVVLLVATGCAVAWAPHLPKVKAEQRRR